jgi:hemolysin activation/secretion protein
MNKVLVRLSLAAAMTMGVIALGSSASAQDQQSSQEPAATTPQQQQPTGAQPDQATAAAPEQQQQQPNETQSNDMKGQDAKSFTGQVAKEKGKIVLKDPVTKMSYQLDDQAKAANYVGKQVKVTGKLDMNSNTIQVESIEPIS